jgi:ABC-type lipoprotein export system ATPase subunit/ABC-type transporter Mla maintaining outer membrane lipid asymmetry permease subunit MlaE
MLQNAKKWPMTESRETTAQQQRLHTIYQLKRTYYSLLTSPTTTTTTTYHRSKAPFLARTMTKTLSSPLVSFQAHSLGRKCPFGNDSVEFELEKGGCLLLKGKSGIGKTTLAMSMAGLTSEATRRKLHIKAVCEWDPSIPVSQRCGVLFQQTTLLDELTVAGNLLVALRACPENSYNNSLSPKERDQKIKQLLDMVGLDFQRDAAKRPSELSGGMGRRACLALQLAQKKRVIVLDEPFTGLDYEAAVSVARELVHLRRLGTALILISHEPEIAAIVMDKEKTEGNHVVTLFEGKSNNDHHHGKPTLFGTTLFDRFLEKLFDYIIYSLPLILLAFAACGMAISMLSADILQRLDVTNQVVDLVDREVRPLIKMLTGEDPSMFTMMGVKFKVRSMLNSTIPQAKATLYAIGMVKLFVLEIGPLLTALLLCGRIGGSYSGKVAMMQATSQNRLLQTLGISPRVWSLYPSLLAALIAAPVLTVIGTAVAVILGDWVGQRYGIIDDHAFYWKEFRTSTFPPLRIVSFAPLWVENTTSTVWEATVLSPNWKTTFSDDYNYTDSLIEIATYPPIYHLLKACCFMLIIMIVAEVCARVKPNLTPRGVPVVITTSVVGSGLLVILADWGFSQLWLLRH